MSGVALSQGLQYDDEPPEGVPGHWVPCPAPGLPLRGPVALRGVPPAGGGHHHALHPPAGETGERAQWGEIG